MGLYLLYCSKRILDETKNSDKNCKKCTRKRETLYGLNAARTLSTHVFISYTRLQLLDKNLTHLFPMQPFSTS